MSIGSVIFSKGRPAQLDLALRSLEVNAPAFAENCRVILGDSEEYAAGYAICEREHPRVIFDRERPNAGFQWLLGHWLRLLAPEKVAFFVDDDVVYRPLPVPDPSKWLDLFPDTVCFSLRLGRNTTHCYPLGGIRQEEPTRLSLGDFDVWRWRGAAGDYGYPASLDGHIFRRDDLCDFLHCAEYGNPNQLEEALVRGVHRNDMWRHHIAAFKESELVGVPANSVSSTHASNRHGEEHPLATNYLNAGYLAGRRLSLDSVIPHTVNAAHVEFPLLWEDA